MATYFLSSGSGNNTTGSSWANAYTTLDALLARTGPAFLAGDIVWVGDDHSETFAQTAAKTWTFPGTALAPNYLYCVDHTVASPTAADLKKTAFIGAGHPTSNFSTSFTGCFYAYGITFAGGVGGSGLLNLIVGNGTAIYLEECCLYMAGTRNGGNNLMFTNSTHINCSYRYKSGNNLIIPVTSAAYNCFLDAQDTAGAFPANPSWVAYTSGVLSWHCEDCDFSALTGPLLPNNTNFGQININMKRCKIATTAVVQVAQSGNPRWGSQTNLIQCGPDGATASFTRNERYTGAGNQTTNYNIWRTGGAQDYGTNISQRHLTGLGCRWNNFHDGIPFAVWNATVGTVNVTLEFIVDTRTWTALPLNDEVWFAVEYFDTANVEGTTSTGTKANNLSTGTTHTASTVAWDCSVTRVASTAYAVGAMIKVGTNTGRVFVCTTAGNSSNEATGSAYTSAVDGGTVNESAAGTGGTAVFKAMWRCKQTHTITVGKEGYIYVTPKFGKVSILGAYVDPLITLS